MRRAWKIYKLLTAQNLKRLMEYKADFLTGAISFLIDQAVGIAFLFIIFSQIPQLAGFSFEQIVFIYGFSQIPKGIDHLLTDNLWCVGYFIVRKGDFDKYMTRPINPLFHVIAETFQIDAIGELVVGIGLMISVAGQVNLYITPLSVILFIISIPFAALIYTAIKIGTAA
ncbi:MAG: ABC transporter permease, partial [Acutalibacteraceae bacterium]